MRDTAAAGPYDAATAHRPPHVKIALADLPHFVRHRPSQSGSSHHPAIAVSNPPKTMTRIRGIAKEDCSGRQHVRAAVGRRRRQTEVHPFSYRSPRTHSSSLPWIIVPLAATDTLVLPSRFIAITLHDQPPLPPSPPPPPQRGAVKPPPLTRDAAPIDAPPAIVPETPIQTPADPFAAFDPGAGIVQGGDFPHRLLHHLPHRPWLRSPGAGWRQYQAAAESQ